MNVLNEVVGRLVKLLSFPAIRSVIENLRPVLVILEKNREAQRNKFIGVEETEVLIDDLGQSLKEVYKLTKDNTNPPNLPLEVKAFMRYLAKLLKDTGVPAACKAPVEDMDVTFEDIKGQDRAKDAIKGAYTRPLMYPGLYPQMKGGILLYGPPGTGKTLFAKAAAASLKRVVLFSATGAEIKGRYVGDTEKNIRRLFECAGEFLASHRDKYDRALIFIDEFDSIGGKRGGDDPHMGNSVNELLQQMDGLKSNKAVKVMAATNHPGSIDSALLSRLNSRIFVDLPDLQSRISLIEKKLQDFYRQPMNSKREESFLDMFSEYGSYAQNGGKSVSFDSRAIATFASYLGPKGPPTPLGKYASSEVEDRANDVAKEKDRIMWLFISLHGSPKELRDSKMEDWSKNPSTFWNDKKNSAAEFFKDASSTFGYSGRDMDSLIDKAIAQAANRATTKYALYKAHELTVTDLPTEDELKSQSDVAVLAAILIDHGIEIPAGDAAQLRELIESSLRNAKKTFWMYDHDASFKFERESHEGSSAPVGWKLLSELVTDSTIDQLSIRNYCLKPQDTLDAIQQTPSTILESEYQKAIDYATGGAASS